MAKPNYWNGQVALICSYCKHYQAFPTVEELKQHIQEAHKRKEKDDN